MPKPLLRIVVFILLPCLVLEPGAKFASANQMSPINQEHFTRFQQQALSMRALSVNLGCRRITFWSLWVAASLALGATTGKAQTYPSSPNYVETRDVPPITQAKALGDLHAGYEETRQQAALYLGQYGDLEAAKFLAKELTTTALRGDDMERYARALSAILERLELSRESVADLLSFTGRQKNLYARFGILIFGGDAPNAAETFLTASLASLSSHLKVFLFMSPRQIAEAEHDPKSAGDVGGFSRPGSSVIVLLASMEPIAYAHEAGHREWDLLPLGIKNALTNAHAKFADDFGRLISDYAKLGNPRLDLTAADRANQAFAEVYSFWMFKPEKLLLTSAVDQSYAVQLFIEQAASKFIFDSDGKRYLRLYLPARGNGGPIVKDVPIEARTPTYAELKDIYWQTLASSIRSWSAESSSHGFDIRSLAEYIARVISPLDLRKEQVADLLNLQGDARDLYMQSGMVLYGADADQLSIFRKWITGQPLSVREGLRLVLFSNQQDKSLIEAIRNHLLGLEGRTLRVLLEQSLTHFLWSDRAQDRVWTSKSMREELFQNYQKAPADIRRLAFRYQNVQSIQIAPSENDAVIAYLNLFRAWVESPEKLFLTSEADSNLPIQFFIEQVANGFTFTDKGRRFVRFYIPMEFHPQSLAYKDIPVGRKPLAYAKLKKQFEKMAAKAARPQRVVEAETVSPKIQVPAAAPAGSTNSKTEKRYPMKSLFDPQAVASRSGLLDGSPRDRKHYGKYGPSDKPGEPDSAAAPNADGPKRNRKVLRQILKAALDEILSNPRPETFGAKPDVLREPGVPHWEARNEEAWDQISLKDQGLLNRILTEREVDAVGWTSLYPEKIMINTSEVGKPYSGRTLYFILDRPIRVSGREITHLRLKGVRPYRSGKTRNVSAHIGNGFVEHVLIPTRAGNLRRRAGWPEPLGGATRRRAENEYQMMVSAAQHRDYETDIPIGWGIYDDLFFVDQSLGWVIAGMEGPDIRLGGMNDRHPNLLSFQDIAVTDKWETMTEQESRGVMQQIGSQLRAYHDAGYFHRFPHFGNIGLRPARMPDKRFSVILRDLDTSIRKDSFQGTLAVKRQQEAAWRFIDFMRVLYGLSGLFGDASELKRIFLESYFDRSQLFDHEVKALLGDIGDRNFINEYEGLHFRDSEEIPSQVLLLNSQHAQYGRLWDALYAAAAPKPPIGGVPSDDDTRHYVQRALKGDAKAIEWLGAFVKDHPGESGAFWDQVTLLGFERDEIEPLLTTPAAVPVSQMPSDWTAAELLDLGCSIIYGEGHLTEGRDQLLKARARAIQEGADDGTKRRIEYEIHQVDDWLEPIHSLDNVQNLQKYLPPEEKVTLKLIRRFQGPGFEAVHVQKMHRMTRMADEVLDFIFVLRPIEGGRYKLVAVAKIRPKGNLIRSSHLLVVERGPSHWMERMITELILGGHAEAWVEETPTSPPADAMYGRLAKNPLLLVEKFGSWGTRITKAPPAAGSTPLTAGPEQSRRAAAPIAQSNNTKEKKFYPVRIGISHEDAAQSELAFSQEGHTATRMSLRGPASKPIVPATVTNRQSLAQRLWLQFVAITIIGSAAASLLLPDKIADIGYLIIRVLFIYVLIRFFTTAVIYGASLDRGKPIGPRPKCAFIGLIDHSYFQPLPFERAGAIYEVFGVRWLRKAFGWAVRHTTIRIWGNEVSLFGGYYSLGKNVNNFVAFSKYFELIHTIGLVFSIYSFVHGQWHWNSVIYFLINFYMPILQRYNRPALLRFLNRRKIGVPAARRAA